MKENPASAETNTTPPRPVAYDANGRPLYAAPVPPPPPEPSLAEKQKPRHKKVATQSHITTVQAQEGQNYNPQIRSQYANEPRVIHATRDHEIEPFEISDELKRRHDESNERFPDLNLSEAEFVIIKLTRHPIGLWIPVASTITIIGLLLVALIAYPMVAENSMTANAPSVLGISIIIMSLIIMVGIGGYVAVWVYLRNCFYLTNESVIQEIQLSLFSRHEQTVSLGSIEDASYKQNGIIQAMFNYGQIRLSTEGDETTYRFQYVENPKKQLALINNAVESFKNGRAVDMPHNEEE